MLISMSRVDNATFSCRAQVVNWLIKCPCQFRAKAQRVHRTGLPESGFFGDQKHPASGRHVFVQPHVGAGDLAAISP